MTEEHLQQPHGVVDPGLMKGVLARAARSYGQILAGAGLVEGVLALLWAWVARPAAIAVTIVGLIAILAALLVFGRNNVSTLRELTNVSRTFLLGSAVLWVLGIILGSIAQGAWAWYLLAVALIALGAWAAAASFGRAKALEGAATPTGAVH